MKTQEQEKQKKTSSLLKRSTLFLQPAYCVIGAAAEGGSVLLIRSCENWEQSQMGS